MCLAFSSTSGLWHLDSDEYAYNRIAAAAVYNILNQMS